MPRADGGDDLLQQTGARLRLVVAVILVLVEIYETGGYHSLSWVHGEECRWIRGRQQWAREEVMGVSAAGAGTSHEVGDTLAVGNVLVEWLQAIDCTT